jgi:hypothetical protein
MNLTDPRTVLAIFFLFFVYWLIFFKADEELTKERNKK